MKRIFAFPFMLFALVVVSGCVEDSACVVVANRIENGVDVHVENFSRSCGVRVVDDSNELLPGLRVMDLIELDVVAKPYFVGLESGWAAQYYCLPHQVLREEGKLGNRWRLELRSCHPSAPFTRDGYEFASVKGFGRACVEERGGALAWTEQFYSSEKPAWDCERSGFSSRTVYDEYDLEQELEVSS